MKIIVEEYIATAAPVGSQKIANKYNLGVGAATIRNEMAELEKEEYISQHYHSAGRIPSDLGYRYYVESLMEDAELPLTEQERIYHQLYQIEEKFEEEQVRLAAIILSQIMKIPAIVTLPKSSEPHFKHLELISLQEFLAMLIIIFEKVRLRRQLLPFERPVSQEELELVANKFNAIYAGLNRAEISAKRTDLSPFEDRIAGTVIKMMEIEEEQGYGKLFVKGLHHIFDQPEFTTKNKNSDISDIIEIFEGKGLIKTIPPSNLEGGVKVIIGKENRNKALQNCSVVISCYGIPYKISGVIGVVGFTRMPYRRAIPTTRLLSQVLGEIVAEIYK